MRRVWRISRALGGAGAAALAFCACGGRASPNGAPHALSQLPDVELTLLVDYTPPQPPPTPGAIASLTYESFGPCPTLNLTTTLDDVPLAFSPGVSGPAGDTCLLGYYLTQNVVSAPQSVLAFTDGVTRASLTATRLLEPRGFTTALADGGAVHAGDVLAFAWSTDTDTIAEDDAYFSNDAGSVEATAQVHGTTVDVTVPTLASGAWTLEVTVVAGPPIVACSGAASCSVSVTASSDMAVTAP